MAISPQINEKNVFYTWVDRYVMMYVQICYVVCTGVCGASNVIMMMYVQIYYVVCTGVCGASSVIMMMYVQICYVVCVGVCGVSNMTSDLSLEHVWVGVFVFTT